MAVAFDAACTSFISSDTGAPTWPFSGTLITVGAGANRALVVLLQFTSTTLPGSLTVTWDSGASNQAMTQITNTFANNGTNCPVLYGLVNPVSGLKTLAVNFTGAIVGAAYAVSFTGVDQIGGDTSFPHGNNNTGTGTGIGTITITSTASDAICACFVDNNTQASATLSDTQIDSFRAGAAEDCAANYAVGTGTHALTCTWEGNRNWAASGTSIAAAGGPAITDHVKRTDFLYIED